ncbi:MAG: serine/threonine-protein phosphatase [Streptosporangiales bacterium]|nr:serine/threonine-protein phosphatase [Streptosporangiales bacterium]
MDVTPAGAAEAIGLRFAARTDVGRARRVNQDAAYASGRVLAVADGMGGHAGGEVASETAIACVRDLDGFTGGDPRSALEGAVTQVGPRLRELAELRPELEGMGTTLTVLLLVGREFALAHVGDSRAYLLRRGDLYRLTEDHTFVGALVKDGTITEAEARSHPRRSLLMRALTSDASAVPDLSRHPAVPGDRYLICSDGLSGVLGPEAVHRGLSARESPDAAAEYLIALALQNGGPDNVTCVVADVVAAA